MSDVDLTKYPEGLKVLAEELELPIPKENVAGREAFVMSLINSLLRQ